MTDFKRVVNVIPLTRVALGGSAIFTYVVPLKLQGQLRPGQLVIVPFGPRKLLGVISAPETARLGTEIKNLKSIIDVATTKPVLSQKALVLADWMARYYVISQGLVIKAMLPKFAKKSKAPEMVGYEKFNPDFILNEYQRQAAMQIGSALGEAQTFLLHGVTGSGKTEVYMQVMQRVLERGQQAILLVPEISLTPQAIERFSRRFGMDRIAFLHSKLKDSERLWMWEKIQANEKSVIIGPRSAVFAPVENLGLIILDEEHDSSYKQYDQNPKYHARTVAKKLSELWDAPLILGDATPAVETYYNTMVGKYRLLKLPHRIKADLGMPQIKVIDMKREAEKGNHSIFSDYLELSLLDNLKRKKQIILFLNRRGAASFVICSDCGYVLRCDKCSVSLVWHSATKRLLCHHCGHVYAHPIACAKCQGTNLKHFGIGTQLVEEELQKLLKDKWTGQAPTVARMDRDTTNDLEKGSQIYSDWAAGKIQILIGTQMISKGWDVGAVGLVGIISADTALYLPDFRTGERVFQTLIQVAGRTGRGREVGEVVLQTLNPDNYVIVAAKLHDYENFYKKEIGERERFKYPPYAKLVKLRVADADAEKAEKTAHTAKAHLEKKNSFSGEILGPAPAFIFKRRGKYQYYIILRSSAGQEFNFYDYLKDLPASVDIDVDPESLL